MKAIFVTLLTILSTCSTLIIYPHNTQASMRGFLSTNGIMFCNANDTITISGSQKDKEIIQQTIEERVKGKNLTQLLDEFQKERGLQIPIKDGWFIINERYSGLDDLLNRYCKLNGGKWITGCDISKKTNSVSSYRGSACINEENKILAFVYDYKIFPGEPNIVDILTLTKSSTLVYGILSNERIVDSIIDLIKKGNDLDFVYMPKKVITKEKDEKGFEKPTTKIINQLKYIVRKLNDKSYYIKEYGTGYDISEMRQSMYLTYVEFCGPFIREKSCSVPFYRHPRTHLHNVIEAYEKPTAFSDIDELNILNNIFQLFGLNFLDEAFFLYIDKEKSYIRRDDDDRRPPLCALDNIWGTAIDLYARFKAGQPGPRGNILSNKKVQLKGSNVVEADGKWTTHDLKVFYSVINHPSLLPFISREGTWVGSISFNPDKLELLEVKLSEIIK